MPGEWKRRIDMGRNEVILIILILASLFSLIQIAGEQMSVVHEIIAGAEEVNLEVINKKIESGELSNHEADFYKPLEFDSHDSSP